MTEHESDHARWIRWVGELVGDVRHALRTLARSPGFTWAALAMLATGIGANTAVFGVVDTFFLRQPTGIRNASEVIRFYVVRDKGMLQTPRGGGGSYADFLTIRNEVAGLSGTAAFLNLSELDLGRGSDSRQVHGQVVSGDFFALLGVKMAAGRPFLVEEDRTVGTHPVAIISYGLWQNQFGGDPAVVGRSLVLNGRSLVVVGIAEKRFKGIGLEAVEVWVPMAMAAPLGLMGDEGSDWRDIPFTAAVKVIARLAPGARLQTVAAQTAAALARAAVPELDPRPRVLVGSLVAASGPNRPDAANLAIWLFAVTGIILVIACSNLANLFLARSAGRRREMASRLALGASPGRLVRQVLAESLVLSLLGTAAGVLLVWWGSLVTGRFPLPQEAGELRGRLLGFAVLVALVSGTIPALISAISAVRSQPARWLRETRTVTHPKRRRIRSALVIVQVALSTVLLIGAGLCVRSLHRVAAVDPGLDTEHILVVSVRLVRAGYAPPAREAIYRAARERLREIPNAERVALTHFAPLYGLRYSTEIRVAGHTISINEHPYVNWVGGGYFETVGTAVLRGRGIQEEDRYGSQPVVVVNQVLARVLAPGGDATGLCLEIPSRMPRGACARVIGIVRDQRDTYLDADVAPVIYLPRDQYPDPSSFVDPYLLVRTRGDAGAIAERVRGVMRTLRPNLPSATVESLGDHLRPELLRFRLGAVLFSVFGALALAVAAMGVYSVISYFVSERRPELAIRRSLGATSTDVVRFVIRQNMLPVGVGIIIGLVVAYAGGRLIEALLFGVSGRDLPSFATAAGFLGVVSLLASLGPAWRGATVDPMVALRAE